MRITQWGEYGVHCSAFIAQRQRSGQATVSAPEIAEAQKIDLLYAQQILQRLRRGSIIESVRGPQGGYKLTRPPEEITLHDILVAAEGDTFVVICESKPLDEHRCSADSGCSLRTIWHELRDHVNEFLTKRTLAQVVEQLINEPAPIQIGKKYEANEIPAPSGGEIAPDSASIPAQ